MKNKILTLAAAFLAQACVSFPDAPPVAVTPAINGDVLISFDGAALGLTVWQAEAPHAVILALHGMNDYSNAFALPGAWWAHHASITTYALDQRGFGRSPAFGVWAGEEIMKADLRAAIDAIRSRHPGLPVYVLGHSMGAAVVMAAHADKPLDGDGLILASPGVWGGAALPVFYRLTLNIAASIAPGKKLTGERAIRQSTDNIPVLRKMLADPLVIKGTRLDAILGVVRVMGAANNRADEVGGDILFLVGERDEIIPVKAMNKVSGKLSGDVDIRHYQDGWHLLFRDIQAQTVWRDVAAWIAAREEKQGDAAGAVIGWATRSVSKG